MELYVVDFSYKNNEGVTFNDRWFIAGKNREGLENIMHLNFEQFKTIGYEPIEYSFRHLHKTDNGYPISINTKKENVKCHTIKRFTKKQWIVSQHKNKRF
ncbi:hypothetical protein Q7A53_06330 [Halobacillus rhizosphaerae]|uniref:hypothetical protein n=1 Tax=Halobacillus rhizosphaerae TaxID=3064889 RepID=UPI00398AFD70